MREFQELLDEVEECLLCPMQVIDHDDERAVARQGLEEAPSRPRDLAGGTAPALESERLDEERSHGLGVVRAREKCLDPPARDRGRLLVANPRRLTHDLPERPVRDPLAVGKAPPREDACLGLDRGQELEGQTRLADPRLPEDGHEPTGVFRDGCGKLLPEHGKLLTPPDERARGAADAHAALGGDTHEPVSRNGLLLSLQRERLDRLCGHRLPGEAVRQLADEHLPRSGRLLQPGRDVHGIAADERLARARVAGDHLAGVDSDAKPDPRAEPALELVVQGLQPPEHLRRGPDGAQRIVLVGDGDAEDGHDRIADELLHGARVALDHHPHLVEVSKHHLAHGLCLEPLAEGGRAAHVAEEDRDRLPPLRRGFREGAPAPSAEAKALGVLGAAVQTRRHWPTLGQRLRNAEWKTSPGR